MPTAPTDPDSSRQEKSLDATLDSIEKQLDHMDSEVRWVAVLDLANIPGPRATDLLIRALKDDQFISVRYQAAVALGNRGDRRAVRALVAALGDPISHVREKAAEALGRIRDPEAIEPLLSAFKDRDRDVRRTVILALVAIGDPAEEKLDRARFSTDPFVKQAAEEALSEIESRKKIREGARR
jgi:HEAT repeat protein